MQYQSFKFLYSHNETEEIKFSLDSKSTIQNITDHWWEVSPLIPETI
jgi:hypothetical protein